MTTSTPMTTSGLNTAAWVSFTYIQFAVALGMSAIGVWALPADQHRAAAA